jgi:hypothetical protein
MYVHVCLHARVHMCLVSASARVRMLLRVLVCVRGRVYACECKRGLQDRER